MLEGEKVRKMRIVFISEPTFEPWDWTNPDKVGIGGSETSHIEMAQRLKLLGHDIVSYSPVPEDSVDPAGVPWRTSRKNEETGRYLYQDEKPDLWIVYRAPQLVDQIPEDGAPVWLVCQDVEYRAMTEERGGRFERIITLCQAHADHWRGKYEYLVKKVCVSSNGSTAPHCTENQAASIPVEVIPRNPKRLIYASSPDRGLIHLLSIFARVKEIVPDAELHIYYGWDNIDKVIAREAELGWGPTVSRAARIKAHVSRLIEETGAVWHGRTGQKVLAVEWQKAGIWCHPSNFQETSCITCMDAQANGAIPLTTPIWAIGENVKHGVFIDGNPETEPLTRARYVLELVRLLLDPARQDAIRQDMQPWARETFDWDVFARQWEGWAIRDTYSDSDSNSSRNRNRNLEASASLRLMREELNTALGVLA